MDEITARLAGKPSPEDAEADAALEASLLVSKRVLAGSEVCFVFRDRPTDSDSGWVLLAGNEPDESLSDIECFEARSVGWALQQDPSLVSVLSAPPDSSFERDSVEAPWQELEEEPD